MFGPRLLENTFNGIFSGRTADRVSNTVEAPISLAKGDSTEAGYECADSLVNLPAAIHDLVADGVGLVKNFNHSRARKTTRVQLCSSNLMSNLTHNLTPYHFINPAKHVGAIIDGDLYETTDALAGERELRDVRDERGDISCDGAHILSNEPESVAIERLLCIDHNFDRDYNFLKYNCGGYTRDVMRMAGFSYPGFVNWGIGAEFRAISDGQEYKDSKKAVMELCDERINTIRALITKLEKGEDVAEEVSVLRNSSQTMSSDLGFQILVSSLRSGNSQALELAHGTLEGKNLPAIYLKSEKKLHKKYKKLFKDMLYGTSRNELRSLEREFPDAYSILKVAAKD